MAGAADERRALDLFEAALGWDEAERDRRLTAEPPEVAQAVRRLLGSEERAAAMLPTRPAEPVSLTEAPPPERIGPYRLTGLIGAGGMGAVYAGERDDGLFEQSVAVKLMRPGLFTAAAMEQFTRERRLLARLRHPGIARLYDGGQDDAGRAYIVMERVAGRPLTEWADAQRLDLRGRVALMLPVCDGVRHAHQALVVHADIKPDNILVEADGQPKLLDFGLARGFDEAASGGGLTDHYASPQRRAGEPPTPADDVYALGVVLADLVQDCARSDRRGAQAGELVAVIAKARAADPAERYVSVEALAADLRRWLERRPVAARPASRRRAATLLVARRPWATAASAAAVLGIVVALVTTTTLYLQAERERAEAERRFADARGMARYMLFDLFEGLNRTPGTLPIRQELAATSRGYLERLSASPKAPAEVKAEAALGYLRLAHVLGQMGERAQSTALVASAERLLATRPASVENDPQWLEVRARLRLMEGFEQLNGDDVKGAVAPLSEAAELYTRAAALRPRDREVVADLWETRLHLADAMASSDDQAGAERALRAELAAAPARLRLLGDHEKAPLLLARNEGQLGSTRYYQQDVAGSVAPYSRAVASLEAENDRRPGRSRTVFELVKALWNLASTLEELNRREDAIALLERAVRLGREQAAVDRENELIGRILLLALSERAGMLARAGRGDQAIAEQRKVVAERQALARAKPDDVVLDREVLFSRRPLGDVMAAAGRPAEACAEYRATLAGWAAHRRRFEITAQIERTEIAPLQEKADACEG